MRANHNRNAAARHPSPRVAGGLLGVRAAGRALFLAGWLGGAALGTDVFAGPDSPPPAGAPATAAESGAGDPTLKDLLPPDLALPLWDKSMELRTGVGWQNNVLLSDSNRKNSGFLATGGEAVALRIPLDGWQARFSMAGDDYVFWRNPGVTHEDLWVATGQVSKDWGENWKTSLLFQYTYLNQVVDLYDLVSNLHDPPLALEGHGLLLRPAVRQQLGDDWWWVGEFDGGRQFFRAPVDSFTRLGPRLILGRHWGGRTDLTLGYALQETAYDHESEANPDGTPVAGTALRTWRQQVGLTVRHYWDGARHWQTDGHLGFTDSRDEGGGYYNYREFGATAQLRWAAAGWEARGGLGLSYRAAPVQAAAVGAPEKFRVTVGTGDVRVEKALNKWCKVYGAWERTVSLTDSPEESYHANTFSAGMEWIF